MTTEELKNLNINLDNLNYRFGELNIIIQCYSLDENDIKEGEHVIYPSIYQPLKNRIYSTSNEGGVNLDNEDEKTDYIEHLKDSAERLKILAYYITKQAEEIETIGYPITNCYYPE